MLDIPKCYSTNSNMIKNNSSVFWTPWLLESTICFDAKINELHKNSSKYCINSIILSLRQNIQNIQIIKITFSECKEYIL